jgi:beta-lactam-binding protein with PASTA domain
VVKFRWATRPILRPTPVIAVAAAWVKQTTFGTAIVSATQLIITSTSVAAGLVISDSPSAGSSVAQKSAVNLALLLEIFPDVFVVEHF